MKLKTSILVFVMLSIASAMFCRNEISEHDESFQARKKSNSRRLQSDDEVDFIVALQINQHKEALHAALLSRSSPSSPLYGQYLTLQQVSERFSASGRDVVSSFFSRMPSARLHASAGGDMLRVWASVRDIEALLNTTLSLVHCLDDDAEADADAHKHSSSTSSTASSTASSSRFAATGRRSLRLRGEYSLPAEVKPHVALLSLATPARYSQPRSSTHLRRQAEAEAERRVNTENVENVKNGENGETKRALAADAKSGDAKEKKEPRYDLQVSPGNSEALLTFSLTCADGSPNLTQPPCRPSPSSSSSSSTSSSSSSSTSSSSTSSTSSVSGESEEEEDWTNMPRLVARVTEFSAHRIAPFPTQARPLLFEIDAKAVFCVDLQSRERCGGQEGRNCSCTAKISPLPRHRQLRVKLYAVSTPSASAASGASTAASGNREKEKWSLLGVSNLFVLTELATVAFVSDLYGIPRGLSARHGATQAIAEFYGEFFAPADLKQFLALSGLPAAEPAESDVKGNLANNELAPGGEAMLDLEYIMGLAPGAKTAFYSFSDRNPTSYENEGFLALLFYLSGHPSPPQVLSLSYGDIEASNFNASRPGAVEYAQRCDLEFLKLSLRGVTVVVSSGDDGVGNTVMRRSREEGCAKAWPSWPASSPYVTTVGATMLSDQPLPLCQELYFQPLQSAGADARTALQVDCSHGSLDSGAGSSFGSLGEVACSAAGGGVITTGGGFSEVYDRATYAPWQSQAVDAYLDSPAFLYSSKDEKKKGLERMGKIAQDDGDSWLTGNANSRKLDHYYHADSLVFNKKGRAYPDVSAYGSSFFVVLGGKKVRESGTSASAPVFAAMVTLWNDKRLALGLPPLGFLNPLLYSAARAVPEAFSDVTAGDNACGLGRSSETAACCDWAFAATPGWDATSGLGTVNFARFADFVLNNQSLLPALFASSTANHDSNPDSNSGSDSDSGSNEGSESVNEMSLSPLALTAIVVSACVIFAIARFALSSLSSSYSRKRLSSSQLSSSNLSSSLTDAVSGSVSDGVYGSFHRDWSPASSLSSTLAPPHKRAGRDLREIEESELLVPKSRRASNGVSNGQRAFSSNRWVGWWHGETQEL